jgi:lipid A disaccharide synthetase
MAFIDLVLCIFPEVVLQPAVNLRALFVGHPMIERFMVIGNRHGRDPNLVGLFPVVFPRCDKFFRCC